MIGIIGEGLPFQTGVVAKILSDQGSSVSAVT